MPVNILFHSITMCMFVSFTLWVSTALEDPFSFSVLNPRRIGLYFVSRVLTVSAILRDPCVKVAFRSLIFVYLLVLFVCFGVKFLLLVKWPNLPLMNMWT